jgi:hypothetical protein
MLKRQKLSLNTLQNFSATSLRKLTRREEAPTELLETPYQFESPIKRLKSAEVQEGISSLNPKNSSGYDLSTGKILKNCLLFE